jgi:hypothetical protein
VASHLAERHIEAQRRLRLIASRVVGQAWRGLGSWNDKDVERFVAVAVPTVLAAQRASVHLTDAYLARAMGRAALGVKPDKLIGAAVRNGVAPETVYARPFVNLWSALKDGRPFEDGINSGFERATSTAEMDVQLSSRATFQAVQNEDDGIYGYQRVADAGACDFCEEVDGAYVKDADASPLHNRCGCGLEPLTAPHPRAAFLPSGESVHDAFAIREHGELGAVLTAPDQHFTTEAQALG